MITHNLKCDVGTTLCNGVYCKEFSEVPKYNIQKDPILQVFVEKAVVFLKQVVLTVYNASPCVYCLRNITTMHKIACYDH